MKTFREILNEGKRDDVYQLKRMKKDIRKIIKKEGIPAVKTSTTAIRGARNVSQEGFEITVERTFGGIMYINYVTSYRKIERGVADNIKKENMDKIADALKREGYEFNYKESSKEITIKYDGNEDKLEYF